VLEGLPIQESDATSWDERAPLIQAEVREKIRRREPIAKNVEAIHEQQLSFGQRLSDKIADIAGSWTFILGFGAVLVIWVSLNSLALLHHWDAYPYILLNLMLSMLAAIQAPVILMSQNREESRDRIRAEHDYEVNLKAELEIEDLRNKLDELRERQWGELMDIQRQQLELLQTQLSSPNEPGA
jgi:uncharacterized membrane protein